MSSESFQLGNARIRPGQSVPDFFLFSLGHAHFLPTQHLFFLWLFNLVHVLSVFRVFSFLLEARTAPEGRTLLFRPFCESVMDTQWSFSYEG